MTRKLSLTILLCTACQLTLAAPLTTPHTFTAGTPAQASQVNENFQAHATAINNIEDVAKYAHPSLYIDGVKRGRFLSFSQSAGVGGVVRLDTGYTISAHLDATGIANGQNHVIQVGMIGFQSDYGLYVTADCTGQPYVTLQVLGQNVNLQPLWIRTGGFVGLFNVNSSYELYYSEKVPSTQTILSRGNLSNCFALSVPNLPVYAVHPNNPAVTGISAVKVGTAFYLPGAADIVFE